MECPTCGETIKYKYAQEKGGLKLHIVRDFGNNQVSSRALCGWSPERWRFSINVPMGHACGNCIRCNESLLN